MAEFESSVRVTASVIYAVAGLIWLVAAGFAGYRIYQILLWPRVEAEVVRSETESYLSTAYRRDASGWNEAVQTRMYSPKALVRYRVQGRQLTAEAKHDVGSSWKWLQDRLTRQWQPGRRIVVYFRREKPEEPIAGLGWNVNTFLPSLMAVAFGFLFYGIGYGLIRGATAAMRFAGR